MLSPRLRYPALAVGCLLAFSGWEAWIRARYAARSDTAAVNRGYEIRTPSYRVCHHGSEF